MNYAQYLCEIQSISRQLTDTLEQKQYAEALDMIQSIEELALLLKNSIAAGSQFLKHNA